MMSLAHRSDDAYHYDGRVVHAPDSTWPGNEWQVVTQVYGELDPAGQQTFMNGESILESRAANPYEVDASQISLGDYIEGGYHLIGDLVEWIVYDRVLAVDERKAIETYLKKRAGILRPSPALVVSIRPSMIGDGWVVTWPAEAGREYQVEKSTNLSPGSWTVERTINAEAEGEIEIPLALGPAGSPAAFYRVRHD